MKLNMKRILKWTIAVMLISSCTKHRKAELAEDQQNSVFAISEFGTLADSSPFALTVTSEARQASDNSPLAMSPEAQGQIHAFEASVPARLKFMFTNLPLLNLKARKFPIVFSVDREFVTAYKAADDIALLNPLEKVLAVSAKEAKLNADIAKASPGQVKSLSESAKSLRDETEQIKVGKKKGVLLVPLFKYKIQGYGVLAKVKNELKEETSRLELKQTEWIQATHVQISAQTDSRLMVGLGADQQRQLKQIFAEEKIDNQTMTAEQLQNRFNVAMKFIEPTAEVFTRLDAGLLHVYEITTADKLSESQRRLLSGDRSTNEIMACSDAAVAQFITKQSKDCVLVLKADVPVSYKKAKLADADAGATSHRVEFEDVDRAHSVGLVEIQENAAAKQVDLTGALDPNSSIKISELQGEFYYRRTFESASNMFLGRTGTSGDLAIIKFELEDKRLVVRSQQALITYTGQSAADREELMSFPVRYVRLVTHDARGVKLTVPQIEQTNKEKAEYALIDWTNNSVPDAVSPLAFYSGGDCFMANSSLTVSDTDMRLATDGILNYSLSGSYTVKPSRECVAIKDVNSAYWAGSAQFNFNVKERISFLRKKDRSEDLQFAENISPMAQAAFNFGVFTLADQVTGNGTLLNRDGSEKYMPIIHDFREGRVLTYHLGGINNQAATPPERRALLVEAAQQVVDEWNASLKLAFQNTPLQRKGDYVKLVVDDANTEGHLGDLDRNYIWFQELPAENGLLGVAQPAANPRSGTIKAANVIIYTGNTFEQTSSLLKVSGISREYEKTVETIKSELVAKMQAERAQAPAADRQQQKEPAAAAPKGASQITVSRIRGMLEQSVAALDLDNSRLQNVVYGMKSKGRVRNPKRQLSRNLFVNTPKGNNVKYELNEDTFLKRLTEIAVKTRAGNNPFEFEIELNDAFIQFGNLSETAKRTLHKRNELLTAAVRFDRNVSRKAGCFEYSRNDINDAAQQLDPDPIKNLNLNFKKNVMSTLSHELGHAFGLLHNFKASADKSNFAHAGEKTGRNYSSIMDYIADIDMHYAGPGPYDVHAVRAAYTGLVEITPAAVGRIPVVDGMLARTAEITKSMGFNSYVHLTKDTINKTGLIKYFEQCDDGGVGDSVLCARFDVGGTASEIVQNYIQDYSRSYLNRNYVHDKILFDVPQKIQIINRNISTFQSIRAFLDEAIMAQMSPPGLPPEQLNALQHETLKAAKLGYQFFHELIRTPSVGNASILRRVVPTTDDKSDDGKEQNEQAERDQKRDFNRDGLIANEERFMLIPYKVKDKEGKETEDYKILEARSLFDVQMNSGLPNVDGEETDGDRGKIDTVGISYDKAFAMLFLLQATAAQTKDDTIQSNISFIDYEQFILGINDPTESPTMNTILQVMMKNLKVGFFVPTDEVDRVDFREINAPVQLSRSLADKTAVATIIGLEQNKWHSFDAFAEMFKVARASETSAPADRFNVAKAGQKRGLGDTKVFFAPQNATGASVLVTVAARNEWFADNQEMLFKEIEALYNADQAYLEPIKKIRDAACAEPESEACKKAVGKKLADYLAENADLASAAKTAADLSAAFVAKLRELNKNGLLLNTQLDDEKSPMNFQRQVEVLKAAVRGNLDFLLMAKPALEGAKDKETVGMLLMQVQKQMSQLKKQNSKLESVPLLATGFAWVGEKVSEDKITLFDGGEISLSRLARMIMSTGKIKADLDQQRDTLDKLGKYSNLVDPDTVLK